MPTSLDVCSSALLVEWPDNQMLRSRALENDVSCIPLETLRGSRSLRGALPIRSCGVEGKKGVGKRIGGQGASQGSLDCQPPAPR